jgi:hypothetical protein
MAMLNNQIVHPPKYGKGSGKGQTNALNLQKIQQKNRLSMGRTSLKAEKTQFTTEINMFIV